MKVLVCGGRDYNNTDRVFEVLDELNSPENEFTCIISGGARGADRLGERYAKERGLSLRVFPARWDVHGRSAGMIRNKEMLDKGKPDLVVAFPGGSGTANMVRIARSAGIKVIVAARIKRKYSRLKFIYDFNAFDELDAFNRIEQRYSQI